MSFETVLPLMFQVRLDNSYMREFIGPAGLLWSTTVQCLEAYLFVPSFDPLGRQHAYLQVTLEASRDLEYFVITQAISFPLFHDPTQLLFLPPFNFLSLVDQARFS
jgi:hypothetical protein